MTQTNRLTDAQLSELRLKLLDEKVSLERRLHDTEHFGLSHDSQRENTAELSTYDNHPADIGTETYERAKDIALTESAEHQLEQVNTALENIEQGAYGICKTCGAPIGYDRLEAIPTTEYCKEHVPDPHPSERRPIEERLLEPPFGRTSLDELASSQNQFDGEDAWQIVASWGTSNTPAMSENRNVDDYKDVYIEADEHEGFVELYESFLATDMYGQNVTVVRSKAYRDYMSSGEGEGLLEPDRTEETY
ncbi:molecular chaperone DnaK [Gordoniibacillus kamchatkensis]|uniref:Molecular chaperone DnaK n=1 Tax=Gordoniibacillus kamchatkensis TaxID=1590651 RepID=A0ABR5ALC6_9BACL|nr:TraR/DksA C4-type zinc finger protein [Paenibacillus sp. VKM B-2647]KIL41765.1 molecular chaperone DnaK [Paenibacillus sp. VKM B-2647]